MDMQRFHVLLVEDNPGDSDLIKAVLSEAPLHTFHLELKTRLADALSYCQEGHRVDVALLDLFLPDSEGLNTVRTVHAALPDLPIVVLTIWDEEAGIQAIHDGAQDYLVKDGLTYEPLVRAIRYAIERMRLELAQRKQRDELAKLADERAELLERERTARRHAEEANELKTKFISLISHELRTPLTSIKGFTTTLTLPNAAWDQDQLHEFLQILSDETSKMEIVIEHLLDISKIRAGTFQIDAQHLSLPSLLDARAAEFQQSAPQHVIQYDIPKTLYPVLADERQISQVFHHIIHNSGKYAPPKSTIEIAAENESEQEIKVQIADSGPGIPPEDRDLLFEPFAKVRAYRLNTTNPGLGLGLPLSRGIIEAHKGRIWFGDRLPHGLIVSFTLPVSPQLALR